MVVNITANDDYNGRFMFSMSSLSVVVEEAGDVVMNDNGMIILSLSLSLFLCLSPSLLPPSLPSSLFSTHIHLLFLFYSC